MRWLRDVPIRSVLTAALLTAVVIPAYANDSAVEVSVGGLRLRKERSVSMEKERLFISKELVRVEYEFRNTSKDTVVSEVAFPLPPIQFDFPEFDSARYFEGFKAWVDGRPIKIEKEIRAYVKKREVTEDLRAAGLTADGSRTLGTSLPTATITRS